MFQGPLVACNWLEKGMACSKVNLDHLQCTASACEVHAHSTELPVWSCLFVVCLSVYHSSWSEIPFKTVCYPMNHIFFFYSEVCVVWPPPSRTLILSKLREGERELFEIFQPEEQHPWSLFLLLICHKGFPLYFLVVWFGRMLNPKPGQQINAIAIVVNWPSCYWLEDKCCHSQIFIKEPHITVYGITHILLNH